MSVKGNTFLEGSNTSVAGSKFSRFVIAVAVAIVDIHCRRLWHLFEQGVECILADNQVDSQVDNQVDILDCTLDYIVGSLTS